MSRKKKGVVRESPQVGKTREKLKKRMESVDQKITPQALEKKMLEIRSWIAKNESSRVPLPLRKVSISAGDLGSAKESQRISSLAEKIQKESALMKEVLRSAMPNHKELALE